MQFGLTIPLQRHLKMDQLPYGKPFDGIYCWDLHIITLSGYSSLLAVHCGSRYTVIVYHMTSADWERLCEIAIENIRRSLTAAGLGEKLISGYMERAGAVQFTKTHGRREVAFLNQAWEDVLALDYTLDRSRKEQPLLEHAVNDIPCHCAGDTSYLTAKEHLKNMIR